MKTDKSKQLLEQALRALPPNNAFKNARNHMVNAIQEITKADKKQASRTNGQILNAHEQWKLNLETSSLVSPLSHNQSINALYKLDGMIAAEQQKIEDIKERQKPKIELELPDDDVDNGDSVIFD